MSREKGKAEKEFGEEILVEQILNALREIKYGYVQITVQDSKVVQIDKTEKYRMCSQKGGDE